MRNIAKFAGPIIFGLFFLWGCGGPCEKLADQICECMKTVERRKNCKAEMDLRGRYEGFSKAINEEACNRAAETCDCLAVRNNEVERCGMTR